MKALGLALLAVGVAVAAMFGARLTPEMHAQLVAQGRAQLLAGAREEAHEAYCASFAQTRPPLATLDGCPEPERGEGEPAPAPAVDVQAVCEGQNAPARDREALIAAARGQLEPHYLRDPSVLTADQERLRTAWLHAAEEAVEPGADAALQRPIQPSARLTAWGGDSGSMFLLGLALVIAGAVLGRIAARREAAEGDAGTDGAPARDLGELLEELHAAVKALADRGASTDGPAREDFDAVKGAVQDLQLERFDPVLATAPRVQAKYGMGPFAEIFGPLSAAERHVNRAWSALVDQHWPEASESLARAAKDLEDARGALGRAAEDA